MCTYSTTTAPINTTTLNTNTDFASLAAQYGVDPQTLAALNPTYSIVSELPAGATLTLPSVNGAGDTFSTGGTVNFGGGFQGVVSGSGNTFTLGTDSSLSITGTGINTLDLGNGQTLSINGPATVTSGADGGLQVSQNGANGMLDGLYGVTFDANGNAHLSQTSLTNGILDSVLMGVGSSSITDSVAGTAGQNIDNTNSPTINIDNNLGGASSTSTTDSTATNNVNNGILLDNGGGSVSASMSTIDGTSNQDVIRAGACAQQRPGNETANLNTSTSQAVSVNDAAWRMAA